MFIGATHRDRLARWYQTVLGLPVTNAATAKLGPTRWAAFDRETAGFGPTQPDYMVNYGVDDGRFARAMDREGNRFERWQPAPGR